MTDLTLLTNPAVTILGERSGAFERMRKRINQLDGLLTFIHSFHEDFDGSHLDYTLELAADTAFEIRELAELINDSTPPVSEAEPMRLSYRQTVEAAEALVEAVHAGELKFLPDGKHEAIVDAAFELEDHISAAREDFLGTKEVRS